MLFSNDDTEVVELPIGDFVTHKDNVVLYEFIIKDNNILCNVTVNSNNKNQYVFPVKGFPKQYTKKVMNKLRKRCKKINKPYLVKTI